MKPRISERLPPERHHLHDAALEQLERAYPYEVEFYDVLGHRATDEQIGQALGWLDIHQYDFEWSNHKVRFADANQAVMFKMGLWTL